MSNLTVGDVTVPVLLEKLRRREWLVPRFQREFVWTVPDVIDLLVSIFEARPIGIATIWEQTEPPELDLNAIYIADYDPDNRCRNDTVLAPVTLFLKNVLQFSTGANAASRLPWRGLRPLYTRNRYAGRYYLDVKTTDEARRVRFEKETDVRRKQYTTDARSIADGLFPLTSNKPNEEPLQQWMRYVQALRDPALYPNAQLPTPDELERRDCIEVIILSEALLESLHFRNVPPEHLDPVWNLDRALEAGTITRPFILESVRRSLVRPDAPWFGFDGSDLLTRLGGADGGTLAVLVDALRDYWR